jgi:5-methylcytosine-specific restriction endonuclease McrA
MLHEANPFCHWCNTYTEMHAPDKSPNKATLDHLKPRRECVSQEQYEADSNHVLACYECNVDRDRVDLALMKHQREQQALVDKLRVTTRRVMVRPVLRTVTVRG